MLPCRGPGWAPRSLFGLELSMFTSSSDGIAVRIISELRRKHQIDDDRETSSFRSTCGLVLDGVTVSFVVPGVDLYCF